MNPRILYLQGAEAYNVVVIMIIGFALVYAMPEEERHGILSRDSFIKSPLVGACIVSLIMAIWILFSYTQEIAQLISR